MLSAIQRCLILGLYMSLSGCGRDEDLPLALQHSDVPLLHFASQQEQDRGTVQPHSYLVAFRQLLQEPRQYFGPPVALFRDHVRALHAPWIRSSTQGSLRFISSLNLSFPGRSFGFKSHIAPMPVFKDQLPVKDSMTSLVEVNFDSEAEARRVLQKWMDDERIWYAEPNYKQALKSSLEDELIQDFKDNETTPWLNEVGWIGALAKISTIENKAQPVIAVMDSGVDVKHPLLQDAIYINESGANKLCRDDLYGCNTTKAEKEILGDGAVNPAGTSGFNEVCPPQSDNCEHGTHVAGIIAARGSKDFSGLCPYCKILVVKVVEIERKGDKEAFAIKDSSILAGLAYVSGFKEAGEPLVRVINASFGKFERSRSVELFIRSLKNFGRGTLVVAAAGNEDTMKRQYPAAFEDVVAVSNISSNFQVPQKSPSSNFGMWVDIAAPGDGQCQSFLDGIESTIPGGGSDCKRGTSMAAPVVAGVAGLILTQEPNLSATQLEARLLDTAVPDFLYQDGINNGYRPSVPGAGLVPLLGSGVVNALAAVDPLLDESPTVATQRADRVRSGCGVLSGQTSMPSGGFAWLLFFLPLVILGKKSWHHF